jgi:molybdopterin-guanine dinucleotide biosynthesis protein A
MPRPTRRSPRRRTVRPATSAAVLAGGQSSRLGFPKALLRLGTGRTLIQETVRKLARLSDDLIVVANDDLFDVTGARLEADRYPGAASLGGIYTAIDAARHARVVVVGCDMPSLSTALLDHLIMLSADYDVVAPRLEGYPEPLHSVYGRGCLAPIRQRVEAGRLKIISFFDEVRVRYVDEPELRELDPELRSFRNVNTPELLREACREFGQPGRESNPRRHP